MCLMNILHSLEFRPSYLVQSMCSLCERVRHYTKYNESKGHTVTKDRQAKLYIVTCHRRFQTRASPGIAQVKFWSIALLAYTILS